MRSEKASEQNILGIDFLIKFSMRFVLSIIIRVPEQGFLIIASVQKISQLDRGKNFLTQH